MPTRGAGHRRPGRLCLLPRLRRLLPSGTERVAGDVTGTPVGLYRRTLRHPVRNAAVPAVGLAPLSTLLAPTSGHGRAKRRPRDITGPRRDVTGRRGSPFARPYGHRDSGVIRVSRHPGLAHRHRGITLVGRSGPRLPSPERLRRLPRARRPARRHLRIVRRPFPGRS
ncbi:hypothetical protein IPZ69_21965 [Streptomyces olivochromogenes]|nr:hypothetical protein [Streptomyces olivochromogenes]